MPRALKDIPTLDGHLTTKDIAQRWGCTQQAIYKLIRQGALVAVRKEHCWFIPTSEVIQAEACGLRPRTKGTSRRGLKDPRWAESEAFRMFRDGAKLADVVCALTLTVKEVDALYTQYRDGDLEERYIKKTIEKPSDS